MRVSRIRGAAATALAFSTVVTAACLDDSITGMRPLSFTLSASTTTAVVDEEVTFNYAATGTNLRLIWIDYRDGSAADTVLFGGGAIEAAGDLTHAFTTAGSFIVAAGALTGVGEETAEVTIQIN